MKPLSAPRGRQLAHLFTPGLTVFLFLLAVLTAAGAPPGQNVQCYNAPATADPGATVCISNGKVVFAGTHPDNQFTVSWRSAAPEAGRVRLVGAGTFEDVRGRNFEGATHYVKVNNLTANTSYQFDIISGTKTFNNGGSHWTIKLGPAVSSPGAPYNIGARVRNPDGDAADGAIVYLSVRDADDAGTQGRSSLLSALIVEEDGGDTFFLDLRQARTRNFAAPFVFDENKDDVIVNVSGAAGRSAGTFKPADLHPPKPPPTLTLSASGAGSVATATPTIPPSITPTPVPATATPELSATPDSTALAGTPTVRPPTASNTPFLEPTLDSSAVPDEPTGEGSPEEVATELVETQVSETLESGTAIAVNPAEPDATAIPGQAPEPTRTRVVRGATATPVAAESNPFLSSNALLTALALVFFVGAVLLGLAAFFVWRR